MLTLLPQFFLHERKKTWDTELLMYLRACAIRLHHSPWPGEIVGGSYIEERFESWNRALALAKLSAPHTANQTKTFVRFPEEVARQKEIYRQRKAEKKVLAQKRLAQQAAKKKAQ